MKLEPQYRRLQRVIQCPEGTGWAVLSTSNSGDAAAEHRQGLQPSRFLMILLSGMDLTASAIGGNFLS
ncbi:hypothetical protein [Rhizobium leguminosarum]|uniref:hypothetical protein n=1 Tax=Rhizobium leguminosarum TaxID=384 RepID=UPI001427DDBE|nr:hypothetical protein [Rhizobium leguminosarum]